LVLEAVHFLWAFEPLGMCWVSVGYLLGIWQILNRYTIQKYGAVWYTAKELYTARECGMGDRWNEKVCFIGGAGHSGSTLLGLVLGSHSQCFYAGEAIKTRYLQNPQANLRKRSCKFCGLDCPVWGNFVISPAQDLYEQISQQVHRSFIVDSSKNLDWIKEQVQQLQSLKVQIYFIFLKRDSRAVVSSRLRKYPDQSPESIIRDWRQQIQETQNFFEQLTSAKISLHYEKFATKPAIATQQLCQFLGIEYEPEMLEYSKQAHHVLGGNNGTQFLVAKSQNLEHKPCSNLSNHNHDYYMQHYQNYGSQIQIDLRWQKELSPAIQNLLESLGGSEYQLTKWEH
jgi:Sulfotransferase family